MRLLISIILMGLSYSAYSMNPNTITVVGSDGKELSVPGDVVKKMRTLDSRLERWKDGNNNEDNSISLIQLNDASKGLDSDDSKAFDSPELASIISLNCCLSFSPDKVKLDSQTLEKLFNCIQNPSKFKKIKDIHRLEDFLVTADYLGADYSMLFNIASYFDGDFNKLSKRTREIIRNMRGRFVQDNKLNLANKRVDSLQAIECTVSPEDRHAITAIDCHGNQIKKLDIKKLKKIFPNLTHLNAQGNCINDVSVGRIGQQGLFIDLSGNWLSEQEVEKIKKAVSSKDLRYIILKGKETSLRVLPDVLRGIVALRTGAAIVCGVARGASCGYIDRLVNAVIIGVSNGSARYSYFTMGSFLSGLFIDSLRRRIFHRFFPHVNQNNNYYQNMDTTVSWATSMALDSGSIRVGALGGSLVLAATTSQRVLQNLINFPNNNAANNMARFTSRYVFLRQYQQGLEFSVEDERMNCARKIILGTIVGIGARGACIVLDNLNQRLPNILAGIQGRRNRLDQELQARRNRLNIEYQISPERQQRIRDRLMAVPKKLYEGEVKKVYGNDGLKLFATPAVNNSPTIVTRSYR